MSYESRSRWKDFWQLHVPLILVLALCAVATVIEYRRAGEGVGRAWVYTFQWPIIGIFAIVIWNRYRKHGNVTKWFTDRYRTRIEAYRAEAEAAEAAKREAAEADPDARAWQEHVARLQAQERDRQPPT